MLPPEEPSRPPDVGNEDRGDDLFWFDEMVMRQGVIVQYNADYGDGDYVRQIARGQAPTFMRYENGELQYWHISAGAINPNRWTTLNSQKIQKAYRDHIARKILAE